jgi:transposase-like protein
LEFRAYNGCSKLVDQVEDLLSERGIEICHETVQFWWNSFAPVFATRD